VYLPSLSEKHSLIWMEGEIVGIVGSEDEITGKVKDKCVY
jgi:hypothetical protein